MILSVSLEGCSRTLYTGSSWPLRTGDSPETRMVPWLIIQVTFTEDAIALIARKARERNLGPRQVCEEIFRDYEYGFNLIKKNSNRSEFVIDREVIEKPNEALDRWIREAINRS